MHLQTVCLFALIVAVAIQEWILWRHRRKRRSEIDAFMEWETYPEPAESLDTMPERLDHGHARRVRHLRPPIVAGHGDPIPFPGDAGIAE